MFASHLAPTFPSQFSTFPLRFCTKTGESKSTNCYTRWNHLWTFLKLKRRTGRNSKARIDSSVLPHSTQWKSWHSWTEDGSRGRQTVKMKTENKRTLSVRMERKVQSMIWPVWGFWVSTDQQRRRRLRVEDPRGNPLPAQSDQHKKESCLSAPAAHSGPIDRSGPSRKSVSHRVSVRPMSDNGGNGQLVGVRINTLVRILNRQ